MQKRPRGQKLLREFLIWHIRHSFNLDVAFGVLADLPYYKLQTGVLTAPSKFSIAEGTVFPSATTAVPVSWTPVTGASKYLVRVLNQTTGQYALYLDDARSPNVTIQVVAGHSYYLWVHAAHESYPTVSPTAYGPASAVAFKISAPVAALPANGRYRIVTGHSSKCLDVRGDSRVNGGEVQQATCAIVGNQFWHLSALGGGAYQIRANNSGLVLDITLNSGVAANGAKAYQWTWLNGENQKFKLVPTTTSGYFMIQALHSGKCLDVDVLAGTFTDGAKAQQWDCDPSKAHQRFKFEGI